MQIICYTGGTCGDLLAALIDPRGVEIKAGRMRFAADRGRLKKPHLFNSDQQRDQYLAEMGSQYLSLPSHDLEYHSRQAHDFIGITVHDPITALWAAERFRKLHRSHVWQEMTKSCGAESLEDYAQILIDFGKLIATRTQKLIRLERIIGGDAAHDLVTLTGLEIDQGLYKRWLEQQ